MKLQVRAFALTCGLVWGFGVFISTWWIILFDGPSADPTLLGRFYPGFSISAVGSIIGLIWALADGVIDGAIFAWLYNRLTDRLGSRT